MKKLFASLFLLLSLNAYSATTGTLLLKGVVGQVLSITVTPETVASNLPLSVTQTDTKVATINEKSNSSTGYKVRITSDNLGNLKRASGTELFPYTMKYNGSSVNLSTGQNFVNSTTSTVNVNRDVTISYTGVPESNMVEGTYTDLVTFEISVN